jgi:hypothetical protein
MGEFDDLIPQKTGPASAPSGGAFDDLVPSAAGSSAEDLQSRARIEAIKARLEKARTEAGGAPGYRDIATDSLLASLQRPIGGALSAAVGGLTGSDPGSTFTERYKASVENENERMARAEKERGVLGTLVGAGASLPLGMAAGGGVAATLPKLVGQGAAIGAASGAAQHAESPESAAKGALEGGAVGGAASGVIGTAAKMLPGARRSAAAEAQAVRGKAPDELRTEAQQFYKEMDKSGIAYGQPQTATLKQGLDDLVANNKFDPAAHPTLSGYFNKLDKLATQPQGAKLTELQSLRSAVATQARSADADTRRAAGEIVGQIDELVHRSAPAINPNNLDVKNLHKEASQKWRAAALADDIEWREGKVARKVAAAPGTSPDVANRGAFRAVEDRVTKPGAYNPYTPDQRELLSRIVKGDPLQNVYRGAGRVADSPVTRAAGGVAAGLAGLHGAGLGLGGIGAGGGAGWAASQGLHGVGALFDRLAAARGQQNIDALLRNITTGSSAKPVYGAATSRDDLAEILAAQMAARAVATQGGK